LQHDIIYFVVMQHCVRPAAAASIIDGHGRGDTRLALLLVDIVIDSANIEECSQ
jgi:hypothetical protein